MQHAIDNFFIDGKYTLLTCSMAITFSQSVRQSLADYKQGTKGGEAKGGITV